MTNTRTLDPREYRIETASIEDITFRELVEGKYSGMQRIGFRLSQLDALPLMEEPKGSGRKVTTGNYSVRVQEGGFLVTGSGVDKTNLLPDGILYVEDIDYNTGIYFTKGTVRPSRETLIHDMIYRTRPDINVVLHTHDRIALKYGRSRSTQRPIFFANAEEAEQVVETLGDNSYVSLPTHGQFIVGRNIEDALFTAERYNCEAMQRTPASRFIGAALATAMAASFALMIGAGVADYLRFRDCKSDGNAGESVEICPARIECLPSPFLTETINPDGTHACTYALVGPS